MDKGKILKIEPRQYQTAIVETAKQKNTLVVLPTGMGKTLIALMLSMDRLEKFPLSKIVLLAPTRPLAEQHYNYFKNNLPELYADMTLFTGKIAPETRKELWKNSTIVFSTPQCIANDVKSGHFSLNNVSLLIEDECHRCLNSYDYVFVAENYTKNSENPRILGLTASPGSKPEIIKKICSNLGIAAVEIRHRNSEDVKPYLQELKTEIIRVDFPEQFEKTRKHLEIIYNKKIDELRNRKLFFTNIITKKTLLDLQKSLQKQIYSGNRHFNLLKGVSVCAQAIKIGHAIELLETQSITTLCKYLQGLYEQANQEQSKAVQQIVKDNHFQEAYAEVLHFEHIKAEHPKMAMLKKVVSEELKNNEKSKIIVFAQFRESIIKICKELNSLKDEGLNAESKIFVGQVVKNDIGLSQKEQRAVLDEFKIGKINILCATSIGEEGLDIPEVNCVVFYEPIPSAIRLIQRRGRTARLMPGKLIMLMTSKTRDESYYWAALHKEKKMYSALDSIQKKFDKQDADEQQKTLELKQE